MDFIFGLIYWRDFMEKDFRFNLEETAGAIGDYGTLLPIIVGAAVVTDISLSTILFFFGLSYIATGIYYRLPIPVEPMKAIGAIAISGALTANEIAGAGIFMGIILLVVGWSDGIEYIKRYIPRWLIRGIQFGLTLILLETALFFLVDDWRIGILSVAIIFAFYFTDVTDISSLVVFGLGLVIGIYYYGFPPVSYLTIPELTLPGLSELGTGFWSGTLPQLPLTLGNAVLATSLLITDLFERRVEEKKLVKSMGLMCIISSPLGGFPMCHGAGGLAAQYRFGARTGGSNIISGVILLIIAFFFASPDIIEIIPYGVLGAMLVFTALQMFRSAVKTEKKTMMFLTGILSYLTNIAVGFIVMFLLHLAIKMFSSDIQNFQG